MRESFTKQWTRRRALMIGTALSVVAIGCEPHSTAPRASARQGQPAKSTVEDVIKPTLVAFDFTPKEVNTTQGPATITVNFTVTDDLSGVVWVLFEFSSPSGSHHVSGSRSFTASTSYSGSVTITIPQFTETGTWKAFARVRDAVGNMREYWPYADPRVDDLSALGFPTELTVMSVQDVTKPRLTAFDFSPKQVNAGPGSATVTVNFTVTDDVSGATSVAVSFGSPSGLSVTGSAYFPRALSHSGSLSVTLPQFAQSGTWTAWARVYDAAGNMREYWPYADPRVDDLSALGFPTELTVVSFQDVTKPVLTAFDFSPKRINTSQGPATVTVAYTVTDDLSGVTGVNVAFRNPSGLYVSGVASFPRALSHTGTVSITLPQFAEMGIWTAFARVHDAVGNMREYFPYAHPGVDDLLALGFPTELFNGNTAPTANAGVDQVVECAGRDGTRVRLDGSASFDADNDVLTYEWFEHGSRVATGERADVTLGLDVHVVTLRVTDAPGAVSEDDLAITVRDTRAPSIQLDVPRAELWPPNHEMRRVASGISATDGCDPAPTLVVEVTSNEPTNGLGDGDTAPDWELVANGDGTFDVFVRAERRGNGKSRVYTITASAFDASRNSASVSRTVTVPHGQGRVGEAGR